MQSELPCPNDGLLAHRRVDRFSCLGITLRSSATIGVQSRLPSRPPADGKDGDKSSSGVVIMRCPCPDLVRELSRCGSLAPESARSRPLRSRRLERRRRWPSEEPPGRAGEAIGGWAALVARSELLASRRLLVEPQESAHGIAAGGYRVLSATREVSSSSLTLGTPANHFPPQSLLNSV